MAHPLHKHEVPRTPRPQTILLLLLDGRQLLQQDQLHMSTQLALQWRQQCRIVILQAVTAQLPPNC